MTARDKERRTIGEYIHLFIAKKSGRFCIGDNLGSTCERILSVEHSVDTIESLSSDFDRVLNFEIGEEVHFFELAVGEAFFDDNPIREHFANKIYLESYGIKLNNTTGVFWEREPNTDKYFVTKRAFDNDTYVNRIVAPKQITTQP